MLTDVIHKTQHTSADHSESVFDIDASCEIAKAYKAEMNRGFINYMAELEAAMPVVASTAKKFLDDRRVHHSKPLLGELFPWFLTDFFALKNEETQRVLSPWLALYSFSFFIDDQLDRQRRPEPTDTLHGSLLLCFAISRLSATLNRQGSWGQAEKYLQASVSAEIQDIQLQHIACDSPGLYNVAIGKGQILKILVLLLSEQFLLDGNVGYKFVDKLLFPFQFFDDIADWRDDLQNKRRTTCVSNTQNSIHPDEYLEDYFAPLEAMLLKGLLPNGLMKAEADLSSALHILISHKPCALKEQTPTEGFIRTLLMQCHQLTRESIALRREWSGLSAQNRKACLDRLDQRLRVVAQAS